MNRWLQQISHEMSCRPKIREIFIAIAILSILAALLMPANLFSGGPRDNAKRASCQSNLKQIGLAVLQYSQDYDEKMPLVAVHAVGSSTAPFEKPYGWADAIQPYLKSTQILQCPQEENTNAGTDGVRAGFTDYWMSTNLSGIETKKIAAPSSTIFSGDGNDGFDGTDARYNRNVLPLYWLQDENSPARRHLGTAIYLFADGHVKGMKPDRVHTARGKAGDYSFAVK